MAPVRPLLNLNLIQGRGVITRAYQALGGDPEATGQLGLHRRVGAEGDHQAARGADPPRRHRLPRAARGGRPVHGQHDWPTRAARSASSTTASSRATRSPRARMELGDRTIDLASIKVPVLVFAGSHRRHRAAGGRAAVVAAAHRVGARSASRSCPAATSACSPAAPPAARPGGRSTSGSTRWSGRDVAACAKKAPAKKAPAKKKRLPRRPLQRRPQRRRRQPPRRPPRRHRLEPLAPLRLGRTRGRSAHDESRRWRCPAASASATAAARSRPARSAPSRG